MFTKVFDISDTAIAAAWVQALPQWGLLIAVIGGGLWALVTARNARRLEASRWLQQINSDFYKSEQFTRVRRDVDGDFDSTIGRILLAQILGNARKLTKEDTEYAVHVDNYLNHFENLLYMVERHQLQQVDAEAMYEYWLSWFRRRENVVARAYAATFGYERLARVAGAGPLVVVCCAPAVARRLERGKDHPHKTSADGQSLLIFENQEEAIEAIKSLDLQTPLACAAVRTSKGTALDVWRI